MIYEGAPSIHLADIARTLRQKRNENYRCLYLNSAPMIAGMRSHLAALGMDVEKEIAEGALVLSADQGHLLDGRFEANRMIEALHVALQLALADGFAGLWAAGDMTWEFGSETNLPKLLDYERRLEVFMHSHPQLCGVCLYHRDTLPRQAIDDALATHPALYVSATLSQLNPAYG